MDIFDYSEFLFLFIGLYYIYFVIRNYRVMNNVSVLREDYKKKFLFTFLGAIGFLLSFQVFYFTSFYKNHPVIEAIIKIILGIDSIFSQTLINEYNQLKSNKRTKKKKDTDVSLFESRNKNKFFQIINRLYLLNLIFKPFVKRRLNK